MRFEQECRDRRFELLGNRVHRVVLLPLKDAQRGMRQCLAQAVDRSFEFGRRGAGKMRLTSRPTVQTLSKLPAPLPSSDRIAAHSEDSRETARISTATAR